MARQTNSEWIETSQRYWDRDVKAYVEPIGWVVLLVSSCEGYVGDIVEILAPGQRERYFKINGAKPKLEFAKKFIRDAKLPDAELLQEDLGELERLIDDRNRVAHNVPMHHVLKHAEKEEFKFAFELRDARDIERVVPIEEIEAIRRRAWNLHDNLGSWTMQIAAQVAGNT